MTLEFRPLEANEIECKATIVNNKIEISLHLKAHTCTKILNETVGPLDWEKSYTNGNKNCIVRIWDSEKKVFVSKEDCGGALTDIDGYKGQASNGFKRVCQLGWGIGIELYTQPTIMISTNDDNVIYNDKGVPVPSKIYRVKSIVYDNKKITNVVIEDIDGNIIYDGPNDKGESNVKPTVTAKTFRHIPEEDDIIIEPGVEENEDVSMIDLPDNTDGFDDDFMDQKVPFGNVDYRKEIEKEINRAKVRRADVLNFLKITSFEDLNNVPDERIEDTLKKLRAMPSKS